jgi:hypothetical protein
MSILDQALKLYIDKQIENGPIRNFQLVVSGESNNLLTLCREAGFGKQSNDIVEKIILPWMTKVEERLKELK